MAIYSRNNDNMDEDPNGDLYDKHEDDILAKRSADAATIFIEDMKYGLIDFFEKKLETLKEVEDLTFSDIKVITKLLQGLIHDHDNELSALQEDYEKESSNLKGFLEDVGCGGLL